jgi:hypothetical protein
MLEILGLLGGQMAGAAAGARGPTGPFDLSVGFLVLIGWIDGFVHVEKRMLLEVVVVAVTATKVLLLRIHQPFRMQSQGCQIDPKIMLEGAMQSLFEAAMYIFVLNWSPAVSKAVSSYFAKFADSSAAIGTPSGTVLSCFVASCLLDSSLFGQLTSRNGLIRMERVRQYRLKTENQQQQTMGYFAPSTN